MSSRFRWLTDRLVRLVPWLRRRQVESDIEKELDLHLALETQENLERGMTRDDATRAARVALGNAARIREDVRAVWSWQWVDDIVRDTQLALRRLGRRPAFTATAVVTIVLGIGANTAVFSVVNTIMAYPIPVDRADELLLVTNTTSESYPTHSYPAYVDFRDRNNVLAGLIAYRIAPMHVSQRTGRARIWGYLTSGNYFDVLGVRPALGRLLGPADDVTPGAHPVAVISYGYWQQRFGGDQRVVGQALTINGLDYIIVGVTPRGFHGTELFFAPDVWVPMMMQPHVEGRGSWLDQRSTHNLSVMGRLAAGGSRIGAEAALNVIATDIARQFPRANDGYRVALQAPGLAGDAIRTPVLGFTLALLGVAALVLVLTYMNLAGLLIAAAADRGREMTMRLALGARRARLVRQLLAEAVVLSVVGGALVAAWRPPLDLPIGIAISADTSVLAFTVVLTLVTALVFGLTPALHGTRVQLAAAIKRGTATTNRRRWPLRDLVLAIQIACAVVLLVGAIVTVRSLQGALTTDLGFNPANLVSASFDLGLQGYDAERGWQFQQRVLNTLSDAPGIDEVALVNPLPLMQYRSQNGIYVDGAPVPAAKDVPRAQVYRASPGYFRTMESVLLDGRDFSPTDDPEGPLVAIVNEALARRIRSDQNPLGMRIRFGEEGAPREVIGIVVTGKHVSLGEEPTPAAFVPATQLYSPAATIVVRSHLGTDAIVRAIEQVVAGDDPTLPLYDTGRLTDRLAVAFLPPRLAAAALTIFGGLAVVLVAVGIFGVVAYTVSSRRREIAIRVAVGATSGRVLALVLGRLGVLVVTGVGIGILVAFAVVPGLQPLLYDLDPRDARAFGIAPLLVLLVAIAASWGPSRRAVRSDPSSALREEYGRAATI